MLYNRLVPVWCKCHRVRVDLPWRSPVLPGAPPAKDQETLPTPPPFVVRWIGKEAEGEMGNLIASLPGSVAILGTDVPFGYVMIGGLVAIFVLTGEHRGLRV